ncbi:MAG: TRAP transporter large permease subunit [Deltaproteobacteria bacterium]|nr:TRAP transporter large permease subunit [Deltaproteobacteria bacterium]
MTLGFIIVFTVLLCSGLPVAFVLGITSLVMMAFSSSTSLLMVPEVMYNAIDSFTLIAVPFFVIAAQFMLKGGTSKYLVEAANCYVRHFWGGLATVSVIGCMIFAAICGSSTATAMAMGIIVIPAMLKEGYPRHFATGVVAASGTMGIMIPPSIALILYGIITERSIPKLFLAGVMPGLLEAALYIGWINWYSRKTGLRGSERATGRETLMATVKAIPALSLPVIVLGGIYSGIVTVTEAAALAAVASIIISLLVYRGVKPRDILPITGEAMMTAGMIMFIITTAVLFGHWITEARIPADLVGFASGMNLSPVLFLLFVNVLLLFLGTFLEVVSIMLITLPILIPVLEHLGIDLIHFGIVMTVNMEVACITPPVGLNLFVLSGATRTPLSEVVRGTFPFVILGFIEIAIVTYVPQFVLFLPNLVMP